MSTLLEWPEEPKVPPPANMQMIDACTMWGYEMCRADAAMARLRVAVEALVTIERHGLSGSSDCAASALAAIGPLPSTAERE